MQVTVSSRELSDLARDLRRAGKRGVTTEAGRRMRRLVQPIVPEMRSAYHAVPSARSPRSAKAVRDRPRGLRDATARGVQIKMSFSGKYAGVRIRVDPRHFPDKQKKLPKYLEGIIGTWRSPNWGRDDRKVQRPHPVFYPTIRRHAPRVRAGLRDVADYMTEQLGGD